MASGADGVDEATIAKRTGLSRSQVKAAIAAVLTMRRAVPPDVDAALDLVGTRRLTGGDPTAERRRNGLQASAPP